MDPMKLEALDRAVRVSLAFGGEETEDTVARAKAFYQFLGSADA